MIIKAAQIKMTIHLKKINKLPNYRILDIDIDDEEIQMT